LDDDGFVTGDDFYNIMTHKVYWEQWFNQHIWFATIYFKHLLNFLSFIQNINFFSTVKILCDHHAAFSHQTVIPEPVSRSYSFLKT
jgi:hypothetical protein